MISCLFLVTVYEKGTFSMEELTTFKQIFHGGGRQMISKDEVFIQLFC